MPRTFTVQGRPSWSEPDARAVLGEFEAWLRCGAPGILVLDADVPVVLAEALRDVARGAGTDVHVREHAGMAA